MFIPVNQSFELKRGKHKPGNAVQRFGDWRKGQPTVMIDNARWIDLGKPDNVRVVIDNAEYNDNA